MLFGFFAPRDSLEWRMLMLLIVFGRALCISPEYIPPFSGPPGEWLPCNDCCLHANMKITAATAATATSATSTSTSTSTTSIDNIVNCCGKCVFSLWTRLQKSHTQLVIILSTSAHWGIFMQSASPYHFDPTIRIRGIRRDRAEYSWFTVTFDP